MASGPSKNSSPSDSSETADDRKWKCPLRLQTHCSWNEQERRKVAREVAPEFSDLHRFAIYLGVSDEEAQWILDHERIKLSYRG